MRVAARTYAQASAGLEKAFRNGYEQAKTQLAAGGLRQLSGFTQEFHIEVPETDVNGVGWKRHCIRFSQMGRVAAVAAGLDGNARLERPKSPREASDGRLRWVVRLEIRLVADP